MSNDYKLHAKLGNLKTVVQLLKAINFKEVKQNFRTLINENSYLGMKNLSKKLYI